MPKRRRRGMKAVEGGVPVTPPPVIATSQFQSNDEVIAAITTMLGEIVDKLSASAPPTPPLTSESPETIMDSDETVKALLTELRTARYEVERAVDAVEARKHSGVAAVMDGLSVELEG